MPDDLAFALELADVADALTMERFRAVDLIVETKPDLTPVTEVDRRVEAELRQRLAAARPDDAVLGEEFGGADTTADRRARRWILDPIDGTKSYVRGLPIWATLLALQEGDEMTLGVVSAPALGRRWWAARGVGAFEREGRRLRVSAVPALADAQLLWSGTEDWDEVGRAEEMLALTRRCWRSRGVGDFWQYMLVAEGAAEVALDPIVSVWDLAAALVIVEEAGGQFTDLGGVRTADGGDAIATNGRVHREALEIIGRPEG